MQIFVTGATGFIGENLSLKLSAMGNIVHALYRNIEKTEKIQHPNIKLFKGDILDAESIKSAIEGCQQIYHVAAFTEVWTKNRESIYNLNVRATEIILELALEFGIEKLIFTSTAGIYGPSADGMINEQTLRKLDYFVEYERTKAIAEERVKEFVLKGLSCVIVNPTRVYGPGVLSKSNSVTVMIKSYSEGKWRIIPGNGKSIGNYVYIDDVVEGHILAMEKGKAGESYILGGTNLNYLEFFEVLKNQTGKSHFMFKLPLFFMLMVSYIAMFITKITGIKPFITPALVKKFNYNWNVSSEKAIKELNYKPNSFSDGVKKTLEWIRTGSRN
jgi:nucleoside-diphosphate-sugar epimerase